VIPLFVYVPSYSFCISPASIGMAITPLFTDIVTEPKPPVATSPVPVPPASAQLFPVFQIFHVACVLAKRGTKIQKVTGVSGGVFTKIINQTNALLYNEKPITLGSIYNGGTQREETTGNDALSHIQELAKRTGYDFEITYDFDSNGKLYLVGNWYERRGVETGKYLREGHNIELSNNLLVEDGREMVNSLEGRGDASTTGTRVSFTGYDLDSIAENGLNHESKTYSGNKEISTLTNNVNSDLQENGYPLKSYDATALDVGDTFVNIGLGNISEIDLNSNGFEGAGLGSHDLVRIAGHEIDAMTRKVRLLLEVVSG